MNGWPRWDRRAAAGALAQYVQRDVVAKLMPEKLAAKLPGPSDESARDRARRIYEVFAEHNIGYVHEPASSGQGKQAIRHPGEVLTRPRQGTCLDIAVTFCGACLDAGLHPLIVALEAARGGGGHALVVIWLGASEYPLRGTVHHTPPDELITQLRAGVDQPGAFLAIDVTGATRRSGGAPTPWEAAIAAGADMVAATTSGGAWRWTVAVDIGLAWCVEDRLAMPRQPLREPLVTPYLTPEPDRGPLMQLRARRSVVPFYARDELDVLLDWCQAPDLEPRTRIAVVRGVGGAGKTHLAAELADRLAAEGWYTGFLARHQDPADLPWLASMVSPLLIVIDYPEDVQSGTVISLLHALSGRSEPTCLVLTARTVSGWWMEITSALDRDGVLYTTLPPLELPRRHPSVTGVFQRALRAFTQLPGRVPTEIDTPPPDRRWTTLDLVMLAWLAALGAQALPTSPQELYDEILDREFDYWTRVCQREGLATPALGRVLPAVGACVTLLAPTRDRVASALRAVDAFDGESKWRHEIAAVVETLLPPDSDSGMVAVRPDSVGERLVLRELGPDPAFLRRCVSSADDQERLNACVSINRAAEVDTPTAEAMVAAVLPEPDLWRQALAVVAAQGGPFRAALEKLADRDDSPLPLVQLAETIPLGHVTLRDLALVATQQTRPPDPASPANVDARAQLAAWWNNLSVQQSETGDRAGALVSITEAVEHYRQLAQANPAAFLPNLATSLNSLATRQADAGEHRRALEAFDAAWISLRPGPRAELMVARSRWRASRDALTGAMADLCAAATQAAQETDAQWAGRSRRAVASAVQELLGSNAATQPLPEWAQRPLPDEFIDTLNEWLGAAEWAERDVLLRAHPELRSGPGRDTVQLARMLYPEVDALVELEAILDDITARGLDDVLAELRAAHDYADLVQRWLETPTWSDSRRFLQEYPELASEPRTLALLEAGSSDAMVAQHLGIARLVARMPIAEIYDTVTDLDMAVDTAMSVVEQGDDSTLSALMLAAPHLGRLPFVTPFLLAAYAVLTEAAPGNNNQLTTPALANLGHAAAEQGNDTQRAAGAARLRRLARSRPEHATALQQLIEILITPRPQEPQISPTADAATAPPNP